MHLLGKPLLLPALWGIRSLGTGYLFKTASAEVYLLSPNRASVKDSMLG